MNRYWILVLDPGLKTESELLVLAFQLQTL